MNHLDPDDAIFLVDAFLDECKKGFSRSVSTVQDHNQVLGRYNFFLPSVNCSCGKTSPVTISDLVESGYWPATVNFETLYMVDLFTTYEDLKITAPGISGQAFVSMLECRTKLFGRSGKICGDTMQRAFLEWAYAKFEVDKLSQHLLTEIYFGQTVQRITEATKELSLQQDTVHQWVSDVQQWTSGATIQNDLQRTTEGLYLGIKQRKFQLYRQSGGNKQRHQLRRKIAVEKKALEVAINKHNAAVGEVEKLPPPNELLAVDNYSWPWECHGDMERKKNVFDKVMLLARLKEEELIVVREVKQHMEYMRSIAGLIEELTFQLTEDTNRKCSTEGLMGKGREGLLCVLKRRLCEVEAQMATARTTYKNILGLQTLSLDDFSEEEDFENTSSTDEEL
ncbi:hypothetical protein D9C73_024464 [Collichthys lucidus]|uniref:CxC3 like cysteine cluster domain-containing protein n=1 Tax=Collichthys lucidus TaxID=240159 RepID=A0A4V6AT02_COLLU|nr:hypothetical protein D9C73_024464 [Collichthys lucidus]